MAENHVQPKVPSNSLRRQKNLGVSLVSFGLALQLISLLLFFFPGSNAFGILSLLGGVVLVVIGLRSYVMAAQRAVPWAAVGLVPVLGPVFVFTMVTLEDALFRVSVPRTVTRTVLILITALLVYMPYMMLHRSSHRMQLRSDVQPQAKLNLSRIYMAEMAFYGQHQRFGNFDEIGFRPQWTKAPYTYRIDRADAPGTVIPSLRDGSVTPDNSLIPAGIRLDPPGFTATATANLDNDAALDQWHVNDAAEGLVRSDSDDLAEMPWRWWPGGSR